MFGMTIYANVPPNAFGGYDMANYGSPITDRYVVNAETGCWEWIASNSGYHRAKPYGTLQREGHRKAHRYMYAKHKGAIPSGMLVLHRCDNPSCVNPDHLWLGTQRDNIIDRNQKARDNTPKGSANPAAKLNERKVGWIKRSLEYGASCAELGREYGVSEVAIGFIKRGKTWKHVP